MNNYHEAFTDNRRKITTEEVMKKEHRSFLHKQRALLAGFALTALAVCSMPGNASASTGAGATILNTVTVNYKDAGGTQNYAANATTTVTVNLVKAGLTLSGRPTASSQGKTAALPSGLTIDSGSTASYLIALTANANGGDTYNLSATLNTPENVAATGVTWSTVRNDGTTAISGANPITVVLGSSIIQANTATTISIPGGSTLAAAIETNATGFKVIVVNGVDYIVTNITAGTAPSNTHVGNTYYTTAVAGTPEALAVITLAANPFGSNATPAFTVDALKGTQAGEQVLVKVDVTASTGATAGTDGTVYFDLATSDSFPGNAVDLPGNGIMTTVRASNVQIQKNVRNCGPAGTSCGTFAATVTGGVNPLDILEYQILVNNAGGSVAKEVSALDAVPVYTTLMCYTAAGGYAGTAEACVTSSIFATVTTGTDTSKITFDTTDDECTVAPNVGAGRASDSAETSSINFYLGNTCDGNTPIGGNVTSGSTYTILYRVKVN
jgi:hypothetical protein